MDISTYRQRVPEGAPEKSTLERLHAKVPEKSTLERLRSGCEINLRAASLARNQPWSGSVGRCPRNQPWSGSVGRSGSVPAEINLGAAPLGAAPFRLRNQPWNGSVPGINLGTAPFRLCPAP